MFNPYSNTPLYGTQAASVGGSLFPSINTPTANMGGFAQPEDWGSVGGAGFGGSEALGGSTFNPQALLGVLGGLQGMRQQPQQQPLAPPPLLGAWGGQRGLVGKQYGI